ncbi:MAG: hypothetical protein AAFU83_00920 [Bacteroidota bacterium]
MEPLLLDTRASGLLSPKGKLLHSVIMASSIIFKMGDISIFFIVLFFYFHGTQVMAIAYIFLFLAGQTYAKDLNFHHAPSTCADLQCFWQAFKSK